MSEFKVGDEVWLSWPENNGTVSIRYVRVTRSRRDVNPGYELKAIDHPTARFAPPYWVTDEQAARWLSREVPKSPALENAAAADLADKLASDFDTAYREMVEGLTRGRFEACGLRPANEGDRLESLEGVQREMNALTEKIQAAHAKMGGPSEDAKRDRILPALRKIVAEWEASAAVHAVLDAIDRGDISDAEGRELLGMAPAVEVPEGLEIAPRDPRPSYEPANISEKDRAHWEDCVAHLAAIKILQSQLTTATQRASQLADECGHLRALADASEANVVAANAKVGDLESAVRSHERTIARLKSEISMLKRACR